MGIPNLLERLQEILDAIEDCFARERQVAELILLYSGIDIVASIDRPEGAQRVTRTDFISWVNKYLLPDSGLACTTADLYGARCSVLHSLGATSDLSRSGKVKQVFYIYGDRSPSDLKLRRLPAEGMVPVHMGELVEAFELGIFRFLNSVRGDTIRAALIRQRSDEIFTKIPG